MGARSFTVLSSRVRFWQKPKLLNGVSTTKRMRNQTKDWNSVEDLTVNSMRSVLVHICAHSDLCGDGAVGKHFMPFQTAQPKWNLINPYVVGLIIEPAFQTEMKWKVLLAGVLIFFSCFFSMRADMAYIHHTLMKIITWTLHSEFLHSAKPTTTKENKKNRPTKVRPKFHAVSKCKHKQIRCNDERALNPY